MTNPWIRRAAGAVWLFAWCATLWCVASPWRELGGLESELLRWLEWWVLLGGLAVGFALGRGVRDAACSASGRTHAQALRLVLYPPAMLTAAALIALSSRSARGAIGVVATAFLSYWAGLDVAVGAVPMMEGKDYAFERPLIADDERTTAGPGERESWDRF